jgi:hypothetical protein
MCTCRWLAHPAASHRAITPATHTMHRSCSYTFSTSLRHSLPVHSGRRRAPKSDITAPAPTDIPPPSLPPSKSTAGGSNAGSTARKIIIGRQPRATLHLLHACCRRMVDATASASEPLACWGALRAGQRAILRAAHAAASPYSGCHSGMHLRHTTSCRSKRPPALSPEQSSRWSPRGQHYPATPYRPGSLGNWHAWCGRSATRSIRSGPAHSCTIVQHLQPPHDHCGYHNCPSATCQPLSKHPPKTTATDLLQRTPLCTPPGSSIRANMFDAHCIVCNGQGVQIPMQRCRCTCLFVPSPDLEASAGPHG